MSTDQTTLETATDRLEALELPDGWERTHVRDLYSKLIKREAVPITDHRGDVRYCNDVVVLVNRQNDRVGVTKGPGASHSWPATDPVAAARRVVDELEAWIDAGNDPYGTPELEDRLEAAVTGE